MLRPRVRMHQIGCDIITHKIMPHSGATHTSPTCYYSLVYRLWGGCSHPSCRRAIQWIMQRMQLTSSSRWIKVHLRPIRLVHREIVFACFRFRSKLLETHQRFDHEYTTFFFFRAAFFLTWTHAAGAGHYLVFFFLFPSFFWSLVWCPFTFSPSSSSSSDQTYFFYVCSLSSWPVIHMLNSHFRIIFLSLSLSLSISAFFLNLRLYAWLIFLCLAFPQFHSICSPSSSPPFLVLGYIHPVDNDHGWVPRRSVHVRQ